MADTTALRNKILQLAIEGKLVEQRAEEGDARALLDEIKAEKAQLIAEKKIKKDKPLAPIEDSEMPFDIPDSWVWVRLGEIFQIINGDRGKNYPAKSTLHKEGFPFISAKNLQNNIVVKNDDLLCLDEIQYNKLGNGKLVKGDMVVCIRGSLGKHGIFPFEKGAIASSLVIVREYVSTIGLKDYLGYYLDAPFFFEEIHRYDNGTAQPNLAAENFKNFLIPLPPLSEQTRIVTKLETMLTEIDGIEQGRKNIEALKDKLRNKALQLAIEGKLVEQRAEEGDARALLDEIKAEKAQLIAEKKIKKDKPLAPIDDSEIPFDIPDSWVWVRLGEVCDKMISTKPTGEYFKYIDIDAIDNKICKIREPKKTLTKNAPSRATRHTQKGDVLFSMVRPYLKNIALVEEDGCIASTGFYVCRPFDGLSSLFLFELMTSEYVVNGLNKFMKGDNSPSINNVDIENLPIPLPPLGEQKRIVEKLDEVMAEIDNL
ncbi:MAG: restriction endonuclease subunit S [Paludibacteraceae bacterium]|nr:restriction endonuclease subunit S [Paludibacteraceae bacterium]